jgi:hypothetical protein
LQTSPSRLPAPTWPKLEEQARRKDVEPIKSADELRADVFESDEELDEFLADLQTFRHANMA